MDTGAEFGRSGPSSALERAYEDYLERVERGEELGFEAFCAEHPELAGELRRLHALTQRVREALPGRSLSARLAERYGSQADPHVTLGDADEKRGIEPASSFSSEVLGRLAERKGAFVRYVLKGEIDRGGQGAVLRVWDEDLRRMLAMKVLLGKSTAPASGLTPPVDARTLGRFLEEAHVTGQLDHPGIVPVHELGLDSDGRVFFTMKLVKGTTLKAVLDLVAEEKEGWTRTRALGVLSKVCEAMAYAHHKGVVHRDLKPANVMVGRFGEVYVMDWGLAKVLGREGHKDLTVAPPDETQELRSERHERAEASPDTPLITVDGEVLGTPAYMPPEQALGRMQEIGPHSDVYAVGAMLYHLLAGHMPYAEPGTRRSNHALLLRVQEELPASLAERAPDAPAELVAICERAMARQPQARYADMGALRADLAAYLEHRVVSAYETGAWAETRKWIARNKPLAASLAAAVALLAGGLVTSMVFKARADARAVELAGANTTITQRNLELARATDEAIQRANDVLSLSAIQDLEELVARAAALWPAHPETIPLYEEWLADARVLIEGRPADPARGVKGRPGLEQHRAQLAEIRKHAKPLTPDQIESDRQARLAEWERVTAELTWMRRMLGEEPWPSEAEVEEALAREELPSDAAGLNALAWPLVDPDPARAAYGGEVRGLVLARRALTAAGDGERAAIRDTLAWALFRAGRFEEALAEEERAVGEAQGTHQHQLAALLEEMQDRVALWRGEEWPAKQAEGVEELARRAAELERAVNERSTFEFEDTEDRWWHAQLSALVSDLEAFTDEETGGLYTAGTFETHGWGIVKRLEFARAIGERSVTGPEARRRWAEAIAAIAGNPEYGGLALWPQMGLLPIGPDPKSGLWEFAHLQSGTAAERGPEGKLVLTEETGLVFVLLPGGAFQMGAQSSDPNGANHDPHAETREGPVHEVVLSPFLMSKYEMTQGQWQRVTGRNPSYYGPDRYWPSWNRDGRGWSALHPVENVSWVACVEVMASLGLSLPSEAQWEYACRGGSSSTYWSGNEATSLQGVANLADAFAKSHAVRTFLCESWLDDGQVVHGEIGTYRANPFGLHDVHGNVQEWCLDAYSDFYAWGPEEDPVVDSLDSPSRVFRGGGSSQPALIARSANRVPSTLDDARDTLGLRPARAIAP